LSVLRIFYRGLLLTAVVFGGSLITLLVQRGEMPPRSLQARVTGWWHRRVADALGIRVRVSGTPNPHGTLFIGNHVSWFDIAAIGGNLPVHFLSKAEVQHWPLLGWLATRAGTLYITRGGKKSASEAIKMMAEVLKKNHHVLLFPEGTTTDGSVKKFHSRLVQSAVDAGCDIQPVAIRYPGPEQREPGTIGNDACPTHPAVLFTDDTGFAESALSIMSTSGITVEVTFLDPVASTGRSRDELAAHAENAIRCYIRDVSRAR
jgi:1-acyl-sn-glycerol-3-phosphate acyltransferase